MRGNCNQIFDPFGRSSCAIAFSASRPDWTGGGLRLRGGPCPPVSFATWAQRAGDSHPQSATSRIIQVEMDS